MSFLRRGEPRRGKAAKATVAALAFGGFQTLAVIGAGSALAVTDCNNFPSDNHIECTIDPAGSLALAVETTAADLDPLAGDGAILQSVNGGAWEAVGSATNSTTTRVEVLGSNGSDEVFTINNNVNGGAPLSGQFNTAITWAIDLGTGAADFFFINAGQGADAVILTNGTFTLNGGGGPILGMEIAQVFGWAGNDTIDGSALTSAVRLIALGQDGDDFISPGAAAALPNPGDFVDGGTSADEVNGDTISYATRTTSVVIDNSNATAGHSANADCDVLDPGDEQDIHVGFENFEAGSSNDCLVGAVGAFEWFVPGDGDDALTGQPTDGDTIDFSTSTAAVTITPTSTCSGTAVGQGTDTFNAFNSFYGSAFDDVLIWNATCMALAGTTPYFAGGDGIDTVDATAATTGTVINLELLDGANPATADSTENALGGSGPDTITGNDLQNSLEGNDGGDFLFGAAANDVLTGGMGNDQFDGGSGADKVSFATNTTDGVNVDMNLGFATSPESGDDGFGGAPAAITGPVEIIQGSPFNDSITGGGGLTTLNFLFAGGNGKDTLTGSGSNDTLKGGAGNDRLRGLEGGDTLKGGKGSNDKGWGGPGVDFCTGVEVEKGCE